MPTEQQRQDAINYKASALIIHYYSVPSRLRINREMHMLFQRMLSGDTLGDADLATAQSNWNTWTYPSAVRAYSKVLIADPTKTSDDTGWPSLSQSTSSLPSVWTSGIPLSLLSGLQTFVDGRISSALSVATEALTALDELSQMLANEGDAVAALTAAIGTKFNQPAGTTGQYLRGDGSLATFPSLADVALSGLYDDLDGLPALGTIAAKDISEFDAAGTAASAAATEATARAAGDAVNATAVASETTARQAAVSSEATARSSADATNAAAITAEISARQSAITSESAARAAADTTNSNAISTETTRAQAAEALKVNTAALAAVATSGSYSDLSNKPTIPAAQVNSDWSAGSGAAQILNKPTLGTAAGQNISAFATAAQGTKADTALQNAAAFDVSGAAAASQTAAASDATSKVATETSRATGAESTLTTSVNAKVPSTRSISTTAPLTGGGDLSADRTLAISAATTSLPGSLSAADKTKLDSIVAPTIQSLTPSVNFTVTPAAGSVPTRTFTFVAPSSAGTVATLGETGIAQGSELTITNTHASNSFIVTDTTGVSETSGNFTVGPGDSISFVYGTDRWYETSRSNN